MKALVSQFPSFQSSASEAFGSQELLLRDLVAEDLDAVLFVEARTYSHPWSRVNFLDSLASNFHMQGLFASTEDITKQELIGYFVAMKGVDEAHLLNLTIAPEFQRRGFAKQLLYMLQSWATLNSLEWIWLEVRASNAAAIALYTSYGFLISGKRKNYYPLGRNGDHSREDALLMSYKIKVCS